MSETQKNMVEYMVACIAEFARNKSMHQKDAFNYLDTYKGLEFLENNYAVEHTFSIDDTIDHLNIICKKNGGSY